MLIATDSYVSAGLDSDEVRGVIRIVFPESVLNLIQEMERSNRNRDNVLGDPTYVFVLVINFNDYFFMLERKYDNKNSAQLDSKECVKLFNYVMTKDK